MGGDRVLVAYYSRTGTTRTVARAMAERLGCDLEEIEDNVPRKGILGYLRAGRDAMSGKETSISPAKHDPGDYDLVIVGTPVWGWSLCPAARTYLARYGDKIRKAAFFTVSEGTEPKKIVSQMEVVWGNKATAVVGFLRKEVVSGGFVGKLDQFLSRLGLPETRSRDQRT